MKAQTRQREWERGCEEIETLKEKEKEFNCNYENEGKFQDKDQKSE